MEEAETSRDEADAALDAARDALEQARLALMNCQGSAPPAKEDDEETPSGPPGVVTPPTGQPAAGCVEGSTKVKVESREKFQVLGGDVRISVPTSAWNKASKGGSMAADDLAGLEQGDLENLFEDLDNRIEVVSIGATIPTKILTVKCIRIVVCSGGQWVETAQTNKVEESADGPNINFRDKVKDKKLAARMVAKVQAKAAELKANEARAKEVSCD